MNLYIIQGRPERIYLKTWRGVGGGGWGRGLCVGVVVERFHDEGRKEGNVLFNDALNTFYLRLYGVRHMVKDHSDSEKRKPAAAT